MSYGFYKMPPRSSYEDYIIKVAGKTPIAIGVAYDLPTVEIQVDRTVSIIIVNLESPKTAETLLHEVDFRAQGYSGDVCVNCSGVRLRWAGHCQVCDDCGTTTGCS